MPAWNHDRVSTSWDPTWLINGWWFATFLRAVPDQQVAHK